MSSSNSSPITVELIQTLLKTGQEAEFSNVQLRSLRVFQHHLDELGREQNAVRRLVEQTMNALTDLDAQAASLLRLKYQEGYSNQQVARQLNIAEATFYRRQREAITQLAEVLDTLEKTALLARQRLLIQRLEVPTYNQLYGVQDALQQIVALLTAERTVEQSLGQALGQAQKMAHPFLLLEGIGGIGKSALADAVLRHIVHHHPSWDVAWVTARQRFLDMGGALHAVETPALTHDALLQDLAIQILGDKKFSTFSAAELIPILQAHLQQSPHIIVVDNLESVVDTEALLPSLRLLGAPTRFLLTARHGLYHHGDVYHFRLPELSWDDAQALLLDEARYRNLPQLLDATTATLWPIYESVGGNPLALRLVAGQMHVHALPEILNDLRMARGLKSEALYTYIYRNAWEHLPEAARLTLLAMPIIMDEGGTLDAIETICHLPSAEIRTALEELVARNLVNSAPDLTQRRYSIHSLTRTFLMEQVLQWQ